jgi:hypothetical protein
MPSSDDTRSAEETATAGGGSSEPAWPPVEARPEAPATEELDKGAPPAATVVPAEESILTKPAEPAVDPTAWEEKASEPKQEMGLSESTLHWLVDGEKPVEPVANDPATSPHYDSRAPVAGRKRTVAVIGGAAVVAFAIAVLLHGQAARHQTAADAPTVEPASVLTRRAESALGAGRSGEAMELAHLAITADPRGADAYVIVGKVERDGGRVAEARDAFRKYLELAPLGTHAQEARGALAALPP